MARKPKQSPEAAAKAGEGPAADPDRGPAEESATAAFVASSPIQIDGVAIAISETVTLTRKRHQTLRAAGVIEGEWPEPRLS